MNILRASLLALACALPAVVFAQWQWVDKDGRKVFSDRSPPADVPAKNILRQPGVKGMPPDAAAAAAAAATTTAAVAVPAPARPAPATLKISGRDKDLEERKSKAEAAENDKKKLEEESNAKARADNCARAKLAKSTFDSGIRVARTTEKGEREIMDDAARATETKRLQGILESDCKAA